MIVLEQVTKVYGDRVAVDGLSFTVGAGEVCVIVGPSGCGKTTTLRMVNRLVEPTSGRILLGGRDVATIPPETLRRGLGYAIQSVGLFPHLTVADNVSTVPRLLGWDAGRREERVTQLLTLVGLPPGDYAGKYPRSLSGGEAQRVGVARALAADPPVLLMDEPFGAVDPITRARLQDEFARIQHELKKTVLFVTHDVDEAIRLADHIALMRDGRLEQHGTPEELLERPATKYVHDFMGADRALKRLGRISVASVMRSSPPAVSSAALGEETVSGIGCDGERFLYLVDERGVLEGWVDCEAVAKGHPPDSAVTRTTPEDVGVRPDASLKEALSRMLEAGVRTIAVTDAGGVLLGDLSMADVEAALDDAGREPGRRDEP